MKKNFLKSGERFMVIFRFWGFKLFSSEPKMESFRIGGAYQ